MLKKILIVLTFTLYFDCSACWASSMEEVRYSVESPEYLSTIYRMYNRVFASLINVVGVSFIFGGAISRYLDIEEQDEISKLVVPFMSSATTVALLSDSAVLLKSNKFSDYLNVFGDISALAGFIYLLFNPEIGGYLILNGFASKSITDGLKIAEKGIESYPLDNKKVNIFINGALLMATIGSVGMVITSPAWVEVIGGGLIWGGVVSVSSYIATKNWFGLREFLRRNVIQPEFSV